MSAIEGANANSGGRSASLPGGVRLIEIEGVWIRPEEISGIEERTWADVYSRVYLRSGVYVEVRLRPDEIVARLEEHRP